MKLIKVVVKKEKNWFGDEYLVYSTEENGVIAELDYPSKEREGRAWVFAQNIPDNGHICFSCMRAGIVGAETACELFLLDKGVDGKPSFQYPEGFNKNDFKYEK